jgi:inosine/xanthosine triphosphate pyrophosphatase family protein
MNLKVCTGSEEKFREFERFFGMKLEWVRQNLREPIADSETVVRFKASQLSDVLIDDTSLVVEGESFGPMIKWKISELDRFVGRKAEFRCYLGIQRFGEIQIYLGVVRGRIVDRVQGGFGFDGHFCPEGSQKAYAEEKPDHLNARYIAVQNFLTQKPAGIFPPLLRWNGKFQEMD